MGDRFAGIPGWHLNQSSALMTDTDAINTVRRRRWPLAGFIN